MISDDALSSPRLVAADFVRIGIVLAATDGPWLRRPGYAAEEEYPDDGNDEDWAGVPGTHGLLLPLYAFNLR
jgi:hypothetical protein